jgi:hypothetical protein
MYWAAVTAAMANTMEKAWFQSERIAKQSAPSFWDALPAASREYFSK